VDLEKLLFVGNGGIIYRNDDFFYHEPHEQKSYKPYENRSSKQFRVNPYNLWLKKKKNQKLSFYIKKKIIPLQKINFK